MAAIAQRWHSLAPEELAVIDAAESPSSNPGARNARGGRDSHRGRGRPFGGRGGRRRGNRTRGSRCSVRYGARGRRHRGPRGRWCHHRTVAGGRAARTIARRDYARSYRRSRGHRSGRASLRRGAGTGRHGYRTILTPDRRGGVAHRYDRLRRLNGSGGRYRCRVGLNRRRHRRVSRRLRCFGHGHRDDRGRFRSPSGFGHDGSDVCWRRRWLNGRTTAPS